MANHKQLTQKQGQPAGNTDLVNQKDGSLSQETAPISPQSSQVSGENESHSAQGQNGEHQDKAKTADESVPTFPPIQAKEQETQATVEVKPAPPIKKEVADSSFGIGWLAIIVVILAIVGVLFIVIKKAKQQKRYSPPKPTYSENDRKLLELAKSISTIYDKT